MNKQLKDKNIVILGAGGGFGQALISKLSKQGAGLLLGDLKQETTEQSAKEAQSEGASRVLTAQVDVTNESSVSTFFETISKEIEHLDILVYLPGVSVASPIPSMAVDDFDRIVDINLKGLFLAVKHFLPRTLPERNPLVTFISSQAATRANPNAPVYCAAKAAVSMFGQGLALQAMGQNVRVTAIKPGPVDTKGFWGDRPVPREKFMQASDVAGVIEFVLTLPPHIVMHEVSFESFEFFKK